MKKIILISSFCMLILSGCENKIATENYAISNNATSKNEGIISELSAKEFALSHAKVNGAM